MTVTFTRTHVIIVLVAVIVALAAALLLSGGSEQVSQNADRETATPVERQSAPVGDDTVANLRIAALPFVSTIERCTQAMEDYGAILLVMTEKGGDNMTRTDAQSIEVEAIAALECFDELRTQMAQMEIDFPVSIRSAEWSGALNAWNGTIDRMRDHEQGWVELRALLVSRGWLD